MLKINNLSLVQGDFSLRADIVCDAGVTAVMGPSGAGKSTLLAAIAGFIAPTGGQMAFAGREFTDLTPAERPVSMLFQDNNLFPHLTIAENVGLGLRGELRLSGQEKEAVAQAIVDVGLEGLAARKPAALSGGQQSRAALARVLLAGRPIVLLDEPFAALGPRLKDEMLDLVRERLIPKGQIVLMVSHDPNDVKRIADQVCLVAEGRVSAAKPTDEIFENPPDALRAYLGDMG